MILKNSTGESWPVSQRSCAQILSAVGGLAPPARCDSRDSTNRALSALRTQPGDLYGTDDPSFCVLISSVFTCGRCQAQIDTSKFGTESGDASVPCEFSMFLPFCLWPPARHFKRAWASAQKMQPRLQAGCPTVQVRSTRRFSYDQHISKSDIHGHLPGRRTK